MRVRSLKSQITMLMIIGLVLFIAVSFILYLSKSAVKKQSYQTIKLAQGTSIETQPIKDFVAKCLDKLAKDAIMLLGRQGGYIYSSQGGTLIDYADTDEGMFFIKRDNANVAYNILPPKFAAYPYSSSTPDYPWQAFPYKTAALNEETFEGFFGISNMPPLNSSEGTNSIQTQVESFIDTNMAVCADFSSFEKQGIEVIMHPPKTSVIIGSSDVTIKSKIPVKISNKEANEFAEISDFSVSINLRLRDIYFFAKELIGNDIKNIKFDIGSINNSRDFIKISLIRNASLNDDLVIVTDEKSLIYGKPFEYEFARRNRAPALYSIKETVLDYPPLHAVNQRDLLKDSKLMADDPDEDSYTFTITPALPKVLNVPQIRFKVEVSDGQFSDYQTITVNRI